MVLVYVGKLYCVVFGNVIRIGCLFVYDYVEKCIFIYIVWVNDVYDGVFRDIEIEVFK